MTEAGSDALGRAFETAFGVEAQTCAPLDATERAQLLELLSKLALARSTRDGARPGVHPGLVEPERAS